MKNKKYIIIGVLFLFLFIICLFLNCFLANKKFDSYKIVYFDDYIPGSQYEISINDNEIEVVKTRFCSAFNCREIEPEVDRFSYSDEKKEILYDFLLDNFDFNNNCLEITNSELNDNQRKLIYGIIFREYNIN